MIMNYYLGIDNGGTMTKASLYTADGKEVKTASVSTKMITTRPDFTERDMDEMWEANCSVIRRVLELTGVNAAEIACIACCGHGKGLYLWGKDGKPVRNGIISTDNRAWEYPRRWEQDGTAKKIFPLTWQHILACQPVSLLAWLRDHEPESMDKIRWVFECKDYVRFRLTGQAFGEITDYSGTNLVNLNTKEYDDALLEAFGLEFLKDKLPPLRKSTDICGTVSKEAAEKTGLLEGTPVAGGMFDIDACAIAVDGAAPERICMIAGTWSINEYIRKTPVTDGSVLMNSIFCLPDYYLIEESSATSAGNNEWFVRTLLPEVKAQAQLDGSSVYKIADGWVESVPAEEFCPIFTPFLMASNVHPNAKASFVGISNYHTRAHLMRSVYEGIAFSHRYHLDKLLATRTQLPVCIRLAGGVTRSKVWVQIFADIMNLPIEVVDVNETGTFGCAITAAVAAGGYPNFAAASKGMIPVSKPVLPIEAHHGIYEKRYKMYRRIISSLDGIWDDMAGLMNKRG